VFRAARPPAGSQIRAEMAHTTRAPVPAIARAPGKVRIREAARDAIIEHGFDLAVSRNITSAAGVSTSLLFYHYASLEECLIDAVETSVEEATRRFEIGVAGLTDPVDRAQLLIEWHIPSSQAQRREWLLTFEFVRASFRLASVADVAARQYGDWHATVAREYGAIAGEARPADGMGADRLIGLSEGLSWQLILGNPSLPEEHVRAILRDTMASDLGIAADDLGRPADHLAGRLRVIRGEGGW
jgi:AcrR family transcriptional regulator